MFNNLSLEINQYAINNVNIAKIKFIQKLSSSNFVTMVSKSNQANLLINSHIFENMLTSCFVTATFVNTLKDIPKYHAKEKYINSSVFQKM